MNEAQPSEGFTALLSILGGEPVEAAAQPDPTPTPDPDREEAASMWQTITSAQLGPEDQAKADRMAPVVNAYLDGDIEREEYERRLASATTIPIPQPPPEASFPHGMPSLPGQGGSGEVGPGSSPGAGGDRAGEGRPAPEPPAG